MSKFYALIDCNNFFVSCELAFNPQYKGRPAIVASGNGNSGIILARTNSVKKMGVAMAAPIFKFERILKENNVKIFPSNFTLYADISARVMDCIRLHIKDVQVYSVDEAFAIFNQIPIKQVLTKCHQLKDFILKSTSIPASIGIAQTKTLAKLANEIAKVEVNSQGIFFIKDISSLSSKFSSLGVETIWGIGRQSLPKLHAYNIYTIVDLVNTYPGLIRKLLGIRGERTLLELQGICTSASDLPKDIDYTQKGISRTGTFYKEISDFQELKKRIMIFTQAASRKLRLQESLASSLNVFIQTSRFKKPMYKNSVSIKLEKSTLSDIDLIKAANTALSKIYLPGKLYKRAGVYLGELTANKDMQLNIFRDNGRNSFRYDEMLMDALDKINEKWGRNSIYIAQTNQYQKKYYVSKSAYTTNWQQLPVVS